AAVADLTEASLVRRQPHAGDGEGARFAMLETIRGYAAGMLAADSVREALTRKRHLEYFADRTAPETSGGWFYPDSTAEWSWYAAEQHNVRAAIATAELVGDAERFADLVLGFAGWHEFAAPTTALTPWLDRIVDDAPDAVHRAVALYCEASQLYAAGNVTGALASLARCDRVARGDKSGLSRGWLGAALALRALALAMIEGTESTAGRAAAVEA